MEDYPTLKMRITTPPVVDGRTFECWTDYNTNVAVYYFNWSTSAYDSVLATTSGANAALHEFTLNVSGGTTPYIRSSDKKIRMRLWFSPNFSISPFTAYIDKVEWGLR